MSTRVDATGANREDFNDTSGLGGHPRGLTTLFFTEMWERFSYYGMRAILFLYMISAVDKGGLGWDEGFAGPIFGLYASSVYFLPLIGGWIADRFIGAKRATFIGGVIIMLGHFALAVPTMTFFYIGLVCVAVGTGFLKSNISAMVGDLYDEKDVRRDAGFSIFYMGINMGAFFAPLACGFLAQSDTFKNFIARMGFDPNSSWHFGFAAAGVGMGFGLVQYILGRDRLRNVGEPPKVSRVDASPLESAQTESAQSNFSTAYVVQMLVVVALAVAVVAGASLIRDFAFALKYVLMPTVLVAGLVAVVLTGMQDKLTFTDWKRLGTIFVLFTFSMVFWMGFEQASTSFNAFAEKLTERRIFGWEFPASWLQSINPLMIIGFAPVFAWIWVKMGRRQPSDPTKFSVGLLFGGLGFVVVALAASFTDAGKVSWVWFLLIYFCHTVGELCLSPVGLSSMTKLAPGRMVSLMLGVWFLSISMGNYFAGLVAGEFEENAAVLVGIFSKVAMILIGGAILLAIITPFVKKLTTKKALEAVPVEP
ncbi:MAG TPA: peptide MFS transporter [Pyrinomonadaceae bacterium]|nr:peptide MFS transporter [Pyrinomonadaceae bacterium]